MEITDKPLDIIFTFLQSVEPMYWAIAGAVLFLLILIPIILRSVKKSKANKIKPVLVLQSFQISPLGKDAWLRLRNVGQLAVLKDLKFKKRADIKSKTNYREVKLGQGNTTSLFLQGTGQERIRENFEIEFLYSDAKGNLYKQVLKLDGKVMQKAKLL